MSVQEEAGLGIFDDPGKALLEVFARHGAAAKDVPPMCPDQVELERLSSLLASVLLDRRSLHLTCESSSPVMQPLTSVLFAKTSRLAPDRRCGATL
jgi:hypothetical protein